MKIQETNINTLHPGLWFCIGSEISVFNDHVGILFHLKVNPWSSHLFPQALDITPTWYFGGSHQVNQQQSGLIDDQSWLLKCFNADFRPRPNLKQFSQFQTELSLGVSVKQSVEGCHAQKKKPYNLILLHIFSNIEWHLCPSWSKILVPQGPEQDEIK